MGFSDHQTRQRLAGVAYVNLACLTWATNMVLGRWLRADIGPLTLTTFRFLLACLVFTILLRGRPPAERRLAPDGRLLLGMAVTGVVAFPAALYFGLRFTTAMNATLIHGLGPLVTGVLAAALTREAMSRRQVGGAVAGLAGVTILISSGSPAFWVDLHLNVGDLITLGSVVLWGLYSVLGRRVMRHRSPLSATALSAYLGLPVLLLSAAWELPAFPLHLSPALVLAVLYIGLVPTVVGFLAWNAGVHRLGPSGAMVFYNTLPLYGVVLGSLVLQERLGLAPLLGGILIVGGALWAALERSKVVQPVPPAGPPAPR
jgi:drug/metabolite transporter (DMT)-like permease